MKKMKLLNLPNMLYIPPGPFIMGSTTEQVELAIKEGLFEEWGLDEQPQLVIDSFGYCICKYPVTNSEYQLFIENTGYPPPAGWKNRIFPDGKSSHPVVNVSWDDAINYCQWLRDVSGLECRLPTEIEWEKAARGTDGRIYPWGDVFALQHANIIDAQIGDTNSVGLFSPIGDSPYGCVDMVGNVWEWCFDQFIYKTSESLQNQDLGNKDNCLRILRGGSFDSLRGLARCATRDRFEQNKFDVYTGFRIAADVK